MKTKIALAFLFLVLVTSLYLQWAGSVRGAVSVCPEPVAIYDFTVPDRLLPPNSVIVGDYWEKMTMAMNSMFQLATIAKVWNATLPIPFTGYSYLYGLPAGKLHLDSIYDIEKLLLLAKQFNITVFTTFEQFINTASRKVIGIEVKYSYNQSQFHANHIYNVDCHKDMDDTCSLLHELNHEASIRSLKPFHFVKCCHILAGYDTSPQEISKLCGTHDQGRVTILIKRWRGIENHARFRLYMKNFAVPHPDPNIPLPHSSNIIHRSIETLSRKLKSPHVKFIGVHLRSEKIMLRNSYNRSLNGKCFELFHELAQEISAFSGLPVVYIGDYVTSSVFGVNMMKHNIHLTESCKTSDEGYRAQVEQAVLARADILILVGGGSFQTQVYNRFRTHNNTGVAYNVCIEEEHKNYFTASLRK